MILLHNPLNLNLPTFIDTIPLFLESVLSKHQSQGYELNIVICDDAYIKDLNTRYRNKQQATDVLSFPTREGETEDIQQEDICLGDVIISLEKAVQQAVLYQVSEQEELTRLAIHGCLHILGYDHETNVQDEKEMLELQDSYLEEYMNGIS